MTIVYSPELQATAKYTNSTATTSLQSDTELECRPYFVDLSQMPPGQLQHLQETGLLEDSDELDICLLGVRHIQYLSQVWKPGSPQLRSSFVALDASRTWILYWTLHGCDLLRHVVDEATGRAILQTLKSCWTPVSIPKEKLVQTRDNGSSPVDPMEDPVLSQALRDGQEDQTVLQGGGFGGGPSQMPHAATTYGAIMALSILACQSRSDLTKGDDDAEPSTLAVEALNYLDEIRLPLYVWFLSLQEPILTGGTRSYATAFRMQHDGEIDVRATYCVMVVATLLGVLTPALTRHAADYVLTCQTYEGGFAGEPGSEAHGGYTFCGTAALQLLGALPRADVAALTQWLCHRQLSYEGGFSGRSNKLVDGCYSFWQGGATALVSMHHERPRSNPTVDPWIEGTGGAPTNGLPFLIDEGMLERYILLCAQDIKGGLRDKPSKHRDFYHTCYNLSGLSIAQQTCTDGEKDGDKPVFGHINSKVEPTHPCFNIRLEYVRFLRNHFQGRPIAT